MSAATEQEFMTVKEVATLLSVPVSTVHHWISRGQGPTSFKVGKHRRFAAEDVRSWISRQRGESA